MMLMYKHKRHTTLASALMAGIATVALTAGGALAQNNTDTTAEGTKTETQTPTNLGTSAETNGEASGEQTATTGGSKAETGTNSGTDTDEQTAATSTGDDAKSDAATEFYDNDSEPAPSFGEGMTGDAAKSQQDQPAGAQGMAQGDDSHRSMKLHSLSQLAGQGDLPPGTMLMIVPDGAARGMMDSWQNQGQNQQTAQGGQDQQDQSWAQRRNERMMQRYQSMLDQQDAIDAEEFRRRMEGQPQMGNMGQQMGQMDMNRNQQMRQMQQQAQRDGGVDRYRRFREDRLSELDDDYARWRADQLSEMDRSYQQWRENFQRRLDQAYMDQRQQQQRGQMMGQMQGQGRDQGQQMGMNGGGSDLLFYDPQTGRMVDPDMAYVLPDGRVIIDSMPHVPGIQPEQLSER